MFPPSAKIISFLLKKNVAICGTRPSTKRFTDLVKLNLSMWSSFRLEPIFDTATVAQKMMLTSKVVKIGSKIIISLC